MFPFLCLPFFIDEFIGWILFNGFQWYTKKIWTIQNIIGVHDIICRHIRFDVTAPFYWIHIHWCIHWNWSSLKQPLVIMCTYWSYIIGLVLIYKLIVQLSLFKWRKTKYSREKNKIRLINFSLKTSKLNQRAFCFRMYTTPTHNTKHSTHIEKY